VPCALDVYSLAKVSYMTPWDENALIFYLYILGCIDFFLYIQTVFRLRQMFVTELQTLHKINVKQM